MMVLLLALGIVIGCGGGDAPAPENTPAVAQGNTPSAPAVNAPVTPGETTPADIDEANTGDSAEIEDLGEKLAAAYIELLSGDTYYIKYRTETMIDSQKIESVTETAVAGEDLAIRANMDGQEGLIVFKDGDTQIVDYENRSVMVMAGGFSAMTDSMLPDSGYIFKGRGEAELFGIKRNYEDYATDGEDMRFFFDGNKLIGFESTMAGISVQTEILEISNKIPPRMFDIPTDYDIIYIGI